MNLKADITIKEINNPIGNWCDSGHTAPKLFKRNGPNSDLEPTKFFEIIKNDGTSQTFCEPCLIIANHMATIKRKHKN